MDVVKYSLRSEYFTVVTRNLLAILRNTSNRCRILKEIYVCRDLYGDTCKKNYVQYSICCFVGFVKLTKNCFINILIISTEYLILMILINNNQN